MVRFSCHAYLKFTFAEGKVNSFDLFYNIYRIKCGTDVFLSEHLYLSVACLGAGIKANFYLSI